MFRGKTVETVMRELVELGWPRLAARAMAHSLCDRTAPLPRWDDLTETPAASESGSPLAR